MRTMFIGLNLIAYENNMQCLNLEQFIKHIAEGKDLTREKRENLMPEVHNLTDDYCKRILEEFGITLD